MQKLRASSKSCDGVATLPISVREIESLQFYRREKPRPKVTEQLRKQKWDKNPGLWMPSPVLLKSCIGAEGLWEGREWVGRHPSLSGLNDLISPALMAETQLCCPMEPHPQAPQAAALPWSPSPPPTEDASFTASCRVENWDEVLNVHQNPCLFSPSFFFSRNICFNDIINKTGEYTVFSMHMEHSLKETIFWQVSTNFKGLKLYRAYSPATVE